MKAILLFATLTALTSACSLSPGYVAPTLEEQAEAAGVVFKGIIQSFTGGPNEGYVVVFRNVKYYKGCGPTALRVSGFQGSSLCGIEPPKVGTSAFVFGCKDDTFDWKLNRIAPFMGLVVEAAGVEDKVNATTKNDFRCISGYHLYTQCKPWIRS